MDTIHVLITHVAYDPEAYVTVFRTRQGVINYLMDYIQLWHEDHGTDDPDEIEKEKKKMKQDILEKGSWSPGDWAEFFYVEKEILE